MDEYGDFLKGTSDLLNQDSFSSKTSDSEMTK